MTAKNDHTGSFMNTKAATDAYREGFDRIFGNKTKVTAPLMEMPPTQMTRQELHDKIASAAGTEYYSPPLHGAPNSAIQGAGADMLKMSDREWAAQDPSLREGCTVHVPGVGDL